MSCKMVTLSTSASTYELAEPEDGRADRLLAADLDGVEAALPHRIPAIVGDRAGSFSAVPDDAVKTAIASAVAAYLATESDRGAANRRSATWAEAEILRDLRGAGPWPSGLASWHQAERPR